MKEDISLWSILLPEKLVVSLHKWRKVSIAEVLVFYNTVIYICRFAFEFNHTTGIIRILDSQCRPKKTEQKMND